MKTLLILAIAGCVFAYFDAEADAAEPKRPMKLEDLFAFKRVADPQISPDGKHIVYQVTTVDLEGNKSTTALWLAATDGQSPPRPFTGAEGKKDTHPRWSPDGKKVLFESNRSGNQQLWVIGIDGGEATKITDISTGAGTAIWSPDGSHIAFVSSVYPEFSELPFVESDKKNKEKEEATEKNPVKAKVFTKLFYRHWDEYVSDKRQHIFVITTEGKGCHDVTPGDRDANPTSSTFSVGDDFTFTPDGKHLVFTAVPEKDAAWSTNYNLCRLRITNNDGGPQSGRHPTNWETLTAGNKAADNGPRFSPDGKKLAYRSQKRAGYEADKWDILVVDVNPDGTFAGSLQNLTESKDISISEFLWMPDSATLLATTEENGGTAVYKIVANKNGVQKFFDGPQLGSFTVSRDGERVAFSRAAMDHPANVAVMGKGIGPENQSIDTNAALLATLDRPRPESVEVEVEGGKMQMWILKPPGFDPAKKWPVAYLVHGGPQGAWDDGWSFRWNPSLWAAQGYVVALPNPRGSTGFGQKFVDDISGDWGGKCYRDLVAGVAYLKKQPFVDADRMGSAGASFGGYMQDWFAVNDIAKEFKCLITHCSVWNFESMWGTTDELWFDEWEHQGLPWEKPGKYREFSPHTRAGELGKYKVPMLVIHNDNDFRCPIGQGHELFTALQRQGVPSRFINFPDEGHWVLKPQNSKFWHQEVFAWLKKHVPPGGR